MNPVQDRSIYFALFPQNIYNSSLKLLNNKSCSLGSLLFASLHREFSFSSQRCCFLSYSCCTFKKKSQHNIGILLTAQTINWQATLPPGGCSLLNFDENCPSSFPNSILLSISTRWQSLHSTVKRKYAILLSSHHVFMSNAWTFACQEQELSLHRTEHS